MMSSLAPAGAAVIAVPRAAPPPETFTVDVTGTLKGTTVITS
jgi:hypothetical protein